MNNKFIATTLSAILMSGLALGVSFAQANDRMERDFYSEPEHYEQEHSAPFMRERQRLVERVNDRQARQLERIHAARETDRISSNEFRRLMREQKFIRMLERDAMSDRFMSRYEFNQINRWLDQADQNIRLARHTPDQRHYSQRPWS